MSFSTIELARLVGVHPNTVRLYEQWGFLSPVPRSPNGYRRFEARHLEELKLARMTFEGGWPGPLLRRSLLGIIRTTVSGNLAQALEEAKAHASLVAAEQERAEKAIQAAERLLPDDEPPVRIGEAAALAGVSTDQIRNWERNRLLRSFRHSGNRYRLYDARAIARLRLIRLLRQAGFSVLAILRMFAQLDRGETKLTLEVDEESLGYATDQWMKTLAREAAKAQAVLLQLARMKETIH